MEKEHCKILVVDDEKELRELLQELLRKEGYLSVEVASSCKEAEAKLSENCYQLILLDVMLTDGNGFDFYKKQKKEGLLSEVPVIFLSARDEDRTRLHGLGLGADDYITKPFLPEELILRIAAVLRRTCHLEEKEQGVQLGESLVSIDAGTVIRQGEKLSLTAKELALFSILYRNKGKIVTTDTLCDALWPDGNFGLESSLLVHMRHLREKIEKSLLNLYFY